MSISVVRKSIGLLEVSQEIASSEANVWVLYILDFKNELNRIHGRSVGLDLLKIISVSAP